MDPSNVSTVVYQVNKTLKEDLKKLPIGTKITFGNNLTLIKTRYNKLENDMVLAYIDELADLQDYRYGKIIKIRFKSVILQLLNIMKGFNQILYK